MAMLSVGHVEASSKLNGITVSPSIQQINLSQNQTTETISSEVTNNTASTIAINITAEDFTSLNQTGGINFYNSSQINNKDTHGLVDYIRIPAPTIVLSPGQSQSVPVMIINADKLAPGGHYAALIFKLANLAGAKGNNVLINQAVSSLIFLSTYGHGTQTLSLTNSVIGSITTTLPKTLNLVFENSGNTQTTPSGIVQLLDSSSKLISQTQINTGSSLILPVSDRLFTLNLTQTAKTGWFGLDQLKIMYRHDGQTNYLVYNKRFLYINQGLLTTVVIIGLLIVIFGIRKLSSKSLYSINK